jgi:hypothetical protein
VRNLIPLPKEISHEESPEFKVSEVEQEEVEEQSEE